MTPGPDPEKFPFGDSDEGYTGGFDSDEGSYYGDSEQGFVGDSEEGFLGGLDSEEGTIGGLDSDEGMIAGLEDSVDSTGPAPDLSSAMRQALPERQVVIEPSNVGGQVDIHETQAPDYPAPGPAPDPRQGQATLPPNYPAVSPDKATVPPGYPAPLRPDVDREATLPPKYPAVEGRQGQETLPPKYPAVEKTTRPPHYPTPQGAAGDEEATVAPGYTPHASDLGSAVHRPPEHVASRADQDTDLGYVPPEYRPETAAPSPPPLADPFESGGVPNPFDSTTGSGSRSVSGWSDRETPATHQSSIIEQRLMKTMELGPDDVAAARDAWDEYLLRTFDSHGDTPIIMPDSDMGPVFGTESQSDIGLIPLPGEAAPIAPPRRMPSASQVSEEIASHVSGMGRVSGMGSVSGMGGVSGTGAVGAKATPLSRLAGLWRGDTLWILLSMGGALLGPILIVAAWEYYGLDRAARPNHEWDRQLSPGGSMGLWFGVAGSILFLLNLTYVLRRRFFLFAKIVSLRLWLNLHFVFGLTGGSLILIHSSLYATNLVARISSAAIAVAVASGIFGRYVLSHVPRREEGETADRIELAVYLAQLRGDLRRKLKSYPRLRTMALQALAQSAPPEDGGQRGLGLVPGMILADIRAFTTRRRFNKQLRKLLEEEARGGDEELEELIEETLEMVRLHGQLGRRLSQYEGVHDLMGIWRALHMILALIMVVSMVLHVVIVLNYSRISLWGN